MRRNAMCVLGGLCSVLLVCGQAFAADPKDSSASEDKATKAYKEFSETPALLTAKALEATDKDSDVRKLLKSQYNDRVAIAKDEYSHLTPGTGSFTREDSERLRLFDSLERVLKAGLELYDSGEERTKFLKDFEDVCKKLDAFSTWYEASSPRGKPKDLEFCQRRARDLQAEVQIQVAKSKKSEK